MPLEVRERQRNGDGAHVVALIDGERTVPFYNYETRTWEPRVEPVELHCLSVEQAEELAPKLMEWAIKRKMKER